MTVGCGTRGAGRTPRASHAASRRGPGFAAALLVAAVVVAAAGCATTRPAPAAPAPQEHEGIYRGGADGSWLAPCSAAAAPVWLTFTGAAVAERDNLLARTSLPAGGRIWIKLSAIPGEGIGPQGRGLLVQQVRELRAADPGECPGVR